MRLKTLFSTPVFQLIISTLVSTLVSSGVIAILITHHYDKKLQSHELKLEKYIVLADELAKFTANQGDMNKLGILLNGALIYSSEDVVREILIFNDKFTVARNNRDKETNQFQITAEQIRPLIGAIRTELDLDSDIFKEKDLRFFMKP